MSSTFETSTTPEYNEKNLKWLERMEGRYSASDSENGTSAADSMPDVTYRFMVPTGCKATMNAHLEVDDWGYLTIRDSAGTERLKISLTSDDGEAGPRGGHEKWHDDKSVTLEAGTYTLTVHHENATYPPEYDSKYNVSECNFIVEGTLDMKYPTSFDFEFDTRSEQRVDMSEQKTEVSAPSYCASGYVFTGTCTVTYNDKSQTSFGVQTGGWMANSSPFKHPTPAQLENNFDAQQWPDTACPDTVESVHTKKKKLGYAFELGKDTNRTDIVFHEASRYGSEGCISVRDAAAWKQIEEDMEKATIAYPIDPVPASVTYSCVQPDYNRYPSGV